MTIYIRSTGNISPQNSLDTEGFFSTRLEATGNFFKSVEPNYDAFVDSKMIRRMSRIVKMGVAAAMTCLKNAKTDNPSAIITATAYGCLEDTSSFLRRLIEFDEKMLSPTAFIQSTHNTVGAQIALLLKCHNYNNTIVHRAFSFENALMESRLLLAEGNGPVLTGAIDEITDDRQAIMSRFGLYRQHAGSGKTAGEGAAFFLLDTKPENYPQVILKDVQTLYKPQHQTEIESFITGFLNRNNLSMKDIDLVLTGHSGNTDQDQTDNGLLKSIFLNKVSFPFKTLCGDFPTASGFAVWFAACLLKGQRKPIWMNDLKLPLRNILIHQHDDQQHHSLFIISGS